MRSITDRDAVTAALTDKTLDSEIRALLGLRIWQVDTDRRIPLSDILQIVIIQPGDSFEIIHDAVGFPLCWDQADQPGFEWMNDHGTYFEICYVLTDDFGLLVFVADHPDTNYTLRFNLLAVANRPGPLENKS